MPIVATETYNKTALAVDNNPGTGQGTVYVSVRKGDTLLFNHADQYGTNWSTNFVCRLGGANALRPSIAVRTNHEVCCVWIESNGINFAKAPHPATNFVGTNIVAFAKAGWGFDMLRRNGAAQDDFFRA